jgi:hypothetical protein
MVFFTMQIIRSPGIMCLLFVWYQNYINIYIKIITDSSFI